MNKSLTDINVRPMAESKGAELTLSKIKRVSVGFPEDILEGIDDIVVETNKSRSLFIREACCFYIQKVKKETMREQMRNGYLEMAEINRILAEELACDFDCSPKLFFADEYCAHASKNVSPNEVPTKWRKS